MLLKYSQYQRRSKLGANGKPHRGSVTGSRIPNKGKGYRKGKIVCSKRLNGHKTYVAKREEEVNARMTVDPTCDNSNDSGLGFDQVDYQPQHSTSFNNQYWSEEVSPVKRPRVDIKLESDNANDNFTFPQIITVQQPQRIFVDKVRKTEVQAKGKIGGGKISGGKAGRSVGKRGYADANSASIARSKDGSVCLEIVSQPENQHRARYQTEGSRGAVKDTSGNSFPLVKLSGYGGSEPAVLQVYIGTDQGKVAPHMFYQACKVSGKNSTPCMEKKLEGTVVIEIEFDPSKDNLVLCDCVGILKERNVDVEHRFPEEATARSRKKSTRCRMVFKSTIKLPSGQTETLQVTSHPIACTQPPGIPEICKKSLCSCPVTGNTELFIIGKNFLKDTKVIFSEGEPSAQDYWECIVQPDKEYLHQSHLICTVPRYRCEDIKESAMINVSIVSGGKSSEPVCFSYTPIGTFPSQHHNTVLAPQTTVAATPTTSSFFAVTQSLGSASQSILQGVPERTGFAPSQKILIIPSSIDMSANSVASSSLTPDAEGMLKTENSVWMKEKIGVVPVSNLSQASTLVQASSSPQDNLLLGVSAVPGLVQTSSISSSPTLLHESNIQTPLMGVSPPSTLLQVSEMVHNAGVLQPTTVPVVLQSATGVMHSPELSPVALSTSPVLPASTRTSPTLEPSPVMDTLSQASSLMQNLVSQTNLVPHQNLTNSDLIQSPPSQSIINTANLVPAIGHSHIISPTLDSNSAIVQSPPTLVKSPTMVLSPTIVHAQSPPMELSPSNTIVHPTNTMDSSSLNPSTLLSDQSLNSPPNMIPVTTIADAATLMQSANVICTNAITNATSSLQIIDSNPMVQTNNLVNTVNVLGPTLTESAIRSSAIVESTNMMPEGSSCTSVVRGLESATPGGAASAVADLSSGQLPSMATIEKFVSGTPLPALSVETYLSHIENKPKLNCSQNLIPPFPNPPQQESPSIAIKQMVVAAAAAALEPKPAEQTISFPGKSIDNINREVLHHTPVLLPAAENPPTHLNYQNQEYLQPQQSNFQLLPRPEQTNQTFTTPQFSTPQMFEQPLFTAPPQAQEKLEAPKPPPPAPQFSAPQMFEPPPIFSAPAPPQEKLEAPKPPPSPAPGTKKCEEGMPVPHELTVMSENDLISYINPSCFDQV